MSALLSLNKLSKFYISGSNVVIGVQDVTLDLNQNEFVAITGESGSGKSTLAACLAGILPYEGGEMLFMGKPTSPFDDVDWEKYRRDSIAYISQNYGILSGNTVEENVVSALRLVGMDEDKALQKAKAILKEVELDHLSNRRAAKLSSGQKQRLSIARALAKPVNVLIADEPTGNLDSENSAKVIELLAKASKSRLVILITHEYDEVKGYATRHLAIQDGHLVLDAEVEAPKREALSLETSKEAPVSTSKKKKTSLGLFTTKLQIKARPIWCLLMSLLVLLTSMSVFSFLGTAISAWDDTNTREYDDSIFKNGDDKRIVVMKSDGTELTQADYQALLGVKNVESLERYGLVTDINYCYRLNEDYVVMYTTVNVGSHLEPSYETQKSVILKDSSLFVKSVPCFKTEKQQDAFLTEGSLPQKFNEVVAAVGEYNIGDVITVYFLDQNNWSISAFVSLDVKVVGLTETLQNGFYFSDDMAKALSDSYDKDNLYWVDETLQEGKAKINPNTYKACHNKLIETIEKMSPIFLESKKGSNYTINVANKVIYWEVGGPSDFSIIYKSDALPKGQSLTVIGENGQNSGKVVSVSEEDFRLLTGNGTSNQVSLTITSYAYKDRVIAKIQALGYEAISPYALCSTLVNTELSNERVQTLLISLGILVAVMVLSILSVSAMFNVQTDSYKQLANIGLSFGIAKKSVMWQLAFFALVGEVLCALAVVIVCGLPLDGAKSNFMVTFLNTIVSVAQHIEWYHVLIIWGVHFATTLLSGPLYFVTLRNKVFPYIRRNTDLDWSLVEEAHHD